MEVRRERERIGRRETAGAPRRSWGARKLASGLSASGELSPPGFPRYLKDVGDGAGRQCGGQAGFLGAAFWGSTPCPPHPQPGPVVFIVPGASPGHLARKCRGAKASESSDAL